MARLDFLALPARQARLELQDLSVRMAMPALLEPRDQLVHVAKMVVTERMVGMVQDPLVLWGHGV